MSSVFCKIHEVSESQFFQEDFLVNFFDHIKDFHKILMFAGFELILFLFVNDADQTFELTNCSSRVKLSRAITL